MRYASDCVYFIGQARYAKRKKGKGILLYLCRVDGKDTSSTPYGVKDCYARGIRVLYPTPDWAYARISLTPLLGKLGIAHA